jgi:glutathione peroxidase
MRVSCGLRSILIANRRARRDQCCVATPLESIPVKTIAGNPSSLAHFAGKVRLVVNVASQCGLTPQYAGLEALYRKYHAQGLEILGFPANEFGAQEPGTEAEISDFCSTNYDVTFPMFAKVVVKGSEQHPLYAALTEAMPNATKLPGTDFRANLAKHGIEPGLPSDVLWNFEKFLIDRNGQVVGRFSPDVTPDAELLISAIERELAREPQTTIV